MSYGPLEGLGTRPSSPCERFWRPPSRGTGRQRNSVERRPWRSGNGDWTSTSPTIRSTVRLNTLGYSATSVLVSNIAPPPVLHWRRVTKAGKNLVRSLAHSRRRAGSPSRRATDRRAACRMPASWPFTAVGSGSVVVRFRAIRGLVLTAVVERLGVPVVLHRNVVCPR